MANKFYGAIALTGGTTGALDNINDSVLSDGDGGYVITDSERIYIYHYDSSDASAADDSPRVIKPDTIGAAAGSFVITEAVVKNVLMATNNAHLKGMTTADAEVSLIGINASDDTIVTAIAGQSVDMTITGTGKVADFAAAGLMLAAGARVNEFSTDDTLAGDSDTAVPTEQAVKGYVDTTLAAGYVTLTGVQTLTNKTLTSPVINTSISGTAFLDEDDMASDSATKVASQQSIKAYVDTHAADTSTHGVGEVADAADLTTHIADTTTHGTTGDIVGVSDAQTLTNKTLTSPVLNTGLSGTAFLDEDDMASDSATKAASQQSIKAYADAITTAFELANTNHYADTSTHGVAEIAGTADIATHAALTATHGVAGAIVGTTDTQTLTNKTLTTPIINQINTASGKAGITLVEDSYLSLHHNELPVLVSTTTGIAVRDTSGTISRLTYQSDAGAQLGYIQMSDVLLQVQLGSDNIILGNLNAGIDLYYNGTKEAETESGYLKATNAFQIASTTNVTGILDEDNMASDSAVSLATQQSIKAYADTKVDAYYETFGSSSTWTVNHNLGVTNVVVKAIVGGVDVTGTYDEPVITMVTANQCTVAWTVATAGDVVVMA